MPMAAAAATLLLALGVAAVWGRTNELPGIPLAQELGTSTTTGGSPTTEPPAGTTTTTAPTTTTRPATTTARTTTTTTTTTTTPPPPPDTAPPQIVKQAATPARIASPPCPVTQSSVQATVTDNIAVTTATLHWTDASGKPGSTSMTLRGADWNAQLGPFGAGTVIWYITATDAAGNVGTGPKATLVVDPCIG
jgi:hypothetical protein